MSLQEGIPHGAIRLANRNRRGIAYKIPRLRLSRYFKALEKERSEAIEKGQPPQDTCLGKACVYILLGNDEESGNAMAYIGESEDVASRLLAHHAKKEFWIEVIILCRTDDDFNKGITLYTEGQLIDLAKKCDRYTLDNTDRASNEKPLNADDRAVADDFIDDIKVLIESLGCKIFTPKRESPIVQTDSRVGVTDVIPVFHTKDGTASGQPTNDGFVVFKGSVIATNENPSLVPASKRMRAILKEDGNIGEDGKLTKDCLFGSPSGAACAVLGSTQNGNIVWGIAQESGGWKTLGEWLKEQVAADGK